MYHLRKHSLNQVSCPCFFYISIIPYFTSYVYPLNYDITPPSLICCPHKSQFFFFTVSYGGSISRPTPGVLSSDRDLALSELTLTAKRISMPPVKIALESVVFEAFFLLFLFVLPERGIESKVDMKGVALSQRWRITIVLMNLRK